MAEIINLRNMRKQKRRTENANVAEANRQKFGRTKAEKQLEKFETEKFESGLDGHKRDET